MGLIKMTRRELRDFSEKRSRLERAVETLDSMRQKAAPVSPELTGMPHAPGVKDKVGDLAIEIADLAARVRYLYEDVERERKRIMDWAFQIDDAILPSVIVIHFARGYSWDATSDIVGGENTGDGLRMMFNRFMDREEAADGERV